MKKNLPDHEFLTGDCLALLPELEEDSVDLVVTSPPYEDCRTYGIDFARAGEEWVAWMFQVVAQLARVCKGLIAIVCQGKTDDFRWSATPMLLAADLHRAGYTLRNPCIFHRVGIPGSGGPDWLRGDTEFILCVTPPGKLFWSDNTACGHAPKWAPGGEMSYRVSDGTRRNQWGSKPSGVSACRKDGSRQSKKRPSHVVQTKRTSCGYKDGDTQAQDGTYTPPAIANPGNLIHVNVGGNLMGDKACHENEAPYPEKLVDFFVLSFCPPRGIVLDSFSGSGTTAAVAKKWGRRSLSIDIRPEQVALAKERLARLTPYLPCFTEEPS
jgi:DNA methylase